MNRNDPDFEKALRAIDRFYATQVNICIAALNRMQSAELADKNIILRAIMCDMPDCGICCRSRGRRLRRRFLGRPGGVCERHVVQSLRYAGRGKRCSGTSGRKAGNRSVWRFRSSGLRCGPTVSRPPYIPLIYLTVLSSKLTAMALADVLPAVDLSGYCDERVMASLGERIAGVLDRMTEMQDGEEGGNPVS